MLVYAMSAAFADVWCALPKVVFSHTLHAVQGNARLAEGSVAAEVAAALGSTEKDVSIGGAGLAAAAIEAGLVDELRMFGVPIVETRTFGSRVAYERYRRAPAAPA